MRTLIIFALVCSLAAASQKFARLEPLEPKLGCDLLDILACAGEIEAAWADCSHLGSSEEIMTCINDILNNLPDCQACVCDVLGFLC